MEALFSVVVKVKLDISRNGGAISVSSVCHKVHTHRNLRFLPRHSVAISLTFDLHLEIAFSSSSVTKRPARKGSCWYTCPSGLGLGPPLLPRTTAWVLPEAVTAPTPMTLLVIWLSKDMKGCVGDPTQFVWYWRLARGILDHRSGLVRWSARSAVSNGDMHCYVTSRRIEKHCFMSAESSCHIRIRVHSANTSSLTDACYLTSQRMPAGKMLQPPHSSA